MSNKTPTWAAILLLWGVLIFTLTIAVSAMFALHNHRVALESLNGRIANLEKLLGGVDGYQCIEWANRTTKDLVGPYIDVECCVDETCGYMLEQCRDHCETDIPEGKSIIILDGEEYTIPSRTFCLKDCDVREFGCREDCQSTYLNPENAERFQKCITPTSLITKTETICTMKVPYFDDGTVYATEQKVTPLPGALDYLPETGGIQNGS